MINKHKAPKKQPVRYESYATNIRIQGMAVVLCKMPYEKQHGNPEKVSEIIGDALEFYYKNQQEKTASDKENAGDDKKELASGEI